MKITEETYIKVVRLNTKTSELVFHMKEFLDLENSESNRLATVRLKEIEAELQGLK